MKLLLFALALLFAQGSTRAQQATSVRAELNQAMDTAQSDYDDALGTVELLEERLKTLKPTELRRFQGELLEVRQATFVATKSYMRAILAAAAYERTMKGTDSLAKERAEISAKLTPIYTKPLTERFFALMDKIMGDMNVYSEDLEKGQKTCPPTKMK